MNDRKYVTKYSVTFQNISTIYNLKYVSVSKISENIYTAFNIKNCSVEQITTKRVNAEIKSIKEHLKNLFSFLEKDLNKTKMLAYIESSPFTLAYFSTNSFRWRKDFDNIDFVFLKEEHRVLQNIYNQINLLINETV